MCTVNSRAGLCNEIDEKLEAVPLSKDVICSRIVAISFSILENVFEELAVSPFLFSMHLNESTDISQRIQLLLFDMCMMTPSKKNSYFVIPFGNYKGRRHLWKWKKVFL
jgi:hypothetical protein